MMTLLEIFDTLSIEQKNRVYQIIGDILENNRTLVYVELKKAVDEIVVAGRRCMDI